MNFTDTMLYFGSRTLTDYQDSKLALYFPNHVCLSICYDSLKIYHFEIFPEYILRSIKADVRCDRSKDTTSTPGKYLVLVIMFCV